MPSAARPGPLPHRDSLPECLFAEHAVCASRENNVDLNESVSRSTSFLLVSWRTFNRVGIVVVVKREEFEVGHGNSGISKFSRSTWLVYHSRAPMINFYHTPSVPKCSRGELCHRAMLTELVCIKFYMNIYFGTMLKTTTVQRIPRSARSLATVTDASAPSTSSDVPPPVAAKPKKEAPKHILHTAVILNRSPLITRTPTALEKSYYAYQSRIQRSLHSPFPDEFYFKAGSLLEGKFATEERQREREAFGAGRRSESDEAAIAASKEVMEVLGEEEAVKPMSRVHEADTKGDVKSLDRKGERNLYLLVRAKDAGGKEVWRFPQGDVQTGELLHDVSPY